MFVAVFAEAFLRSSGPSTRVLSSSSIFPQHCEQKMFTELVWDPRSRLHSGDQPPEAGCPHIGTTTAAEAAEVIAVMDLDGHLRTFPNGR